MTEALLLLVFLTSLGVLLWYSHRGSNLWDATVTPLASIIGSGFLVVAPLLHLIGGSLAILYMLVILVLAYAVGHALRFNIEHEEELTQEKYPTLVGVERLSNLVLSFAYIVSVAFYLRLLASFLMAGLWQKNELLENAITTLVLAGIGISGYLGGLKRLEWLEKYSVSIKLAVIAALLLGIFLHDIKNPHLVWESKPVSFDTFRYLGGILLIVQGFETSKYLRGAYSRKLRVRSMRLAQVISALIYIAFIALVLPILSGTEHGVDETEIIEISRVVSHLLPYLLLLGAVMSQFSASVADTVGSGGLLQMETGGRLSARLGYVITAVLGIALVWSANVFEIISYASRAFAFYYLLQTLIAFGLAVRRSKPNAFLFFIVAAVLTFVVLLGKPVEGGS